MSTIYGADKQTWKRVGKATHWVERESRPPSNTNERSNPSNSTRNIYALITGESAVSGYEGYEVRWDGSEWRKLGDGFTWGDSAKFRPLLEINGDDLDIPDSSGAVDRVYQVQRLVGLDGKIYWFVVGSMEGVALADVGGKTVDADDLLTAVSVTTLEGATISGQTVYCGNYASSGYVFATGTILRVLKCSIVVDSETIGAWLPLDLWHVQGTAVLSGVTASSDTLTGIRVNLPDGNYLESQTVVVSGASGFKFPSTYYTPVIYDLVSGEWNGSLSNIPPGTVEGQLLQWDNTNKTWVVCPASVSENAILYRGSTSWEILAKPTYTSVLMSNGGAPYWQTLETFTCPSTSA